MSELLPTWLITFLSKQTAEEFSFRHNDGCEISIKGKRNEDSKWVVSVSVKVLPYFAWGCNNLITDFVGTPKSIILHYVMQVINQMTDYNASGRDKLVPYLKGGLE